MQCIVATCSSINYRGFFSLQIYFIFVNLHVKASSIFKLSCDFILPSKSVNKSIWTVELGLAARVKILLIKLLMFLFIGNESEYWFKDTESFSHFPSCLHQKIWVDSKIFRIVMFIHFDFSGISINTSSSSIEQDNS